MKWGNKGGDNIYSIDIGLHGILEGMGANNQVATSHGAHIGFSIIVIDDGRIP